jgi:drug/metabolite transporter (DMT)-like permease
VIPITFIAAIFVWDGINGKQLFLVSLITIVATIAQFSLNYALKRGEISFLLPLDYLRLIWAVWLGYIMFSEIPLNNIWIGGTIIVASTTYIGIRENYLNSKKTKS